MTTLAPFSIGLDWLTFNMEGPPNLCEISEPREWLNAGYLVPTGKSTKVMSRIVHLVDHNEVKLLTIAGVPYSAAIGPPTWCQVQFHNETLYTGQWSALYDQLRMMGYTYRGVSRVDIAADGVEGNGGDFLEPIRNVWNGGARYNSRAVWQPRLRGNKIDGAAIGSPASNKFIRVYNKSRELKTVDKPWILDKWRNVGVDPVELAADVWRFELRTKGREVKRYFQDCVNSDWPEQLRRPEYLAELLSSLCVSMYNFTTTEARYEKRVPVMAWDFSMIEGQNPEPAARSARSYKLPLNQVKSTIRTLTIIGLRTGDGRHRELAAMYAAAAGLQRWYEQRAPEWRKQLIKINDQADPETLALFNQLERL